MKEALEYRSFSIAVESGTTEAGKCWGKYRVSAASGEAEKVMHRHAIGGFGSERMHETSDTRAVNPEMLSVQHLVEMAQREIDLLLSRDRE